ncbi:MAG: Ku protein [Actinomycetota bacterium]
MPRAIWTGAISFGLVSVPVKIYSATESKDVSFHQLEEETGKRIDHKRFATGTDREVDYDDLVKGYEVSKGTYVVVTPEELQSVEPGRSRTIDIEDFVALDEIDPIYFEKSYYLAAARDEGTKAYRLLREALRRSERVAIGRFVMRTKQYLGAIRVSGDVLVLETMFFGDEIRDTKDLDLPAKGKLADRELRIAEQLIDSMTVEFDPSSYADTYRERVLELIDQKAKGKEIAVEPDEELAPVTDLLAALEASLEDARAGKKRGRGRRRSGDDLGGLSKDELYDRAADAGIEGRSKMTKDDLIDALRAAS